MILIKNGRVIDPKSNTDKIMDIVIDGEKIKFMGQVKEEIDFDKVIDASDKIVAPGFIDVHVHFRDPGLTYKEDIKTGAQAAIAGGYTAVVCMANTKPVVDNEETLSYVIEKGKSTGIHVFSAAAITKGFDGKTLTDMEKLKKSGAVGFTDDGIPIRDEKIVFEAMKQAKRLHMPLSFHEENPEFITNNGINEGEVAEKLGIKGSPQIAEDTLVARDCMLALATGARVDIQHISSKVSVDMVRFAKAHGADISAEATPHHFTLTQEAVLEHQTLAKMNPPLRTEEDRKAIIKGLQDGTIDMIATDHAPHSEEEKSKSLTQAPSGIIGLETAFALGVTSLVKEGYLTMMKLIEKMTINPAAFYNFDLGYLAENHAADIVILDENEIWTVKEYKSKAKNSPFTGKKLTGKVKMTICNGKIVYEDKE